MTRVARLLKHAYPSRRGLEIYGGLIVFQLFIALVLPGFQQEGLPVPSLRGKRLPYNCNALACWYATLVAAATLHFTGIFHLGELIDHFGEMMTWAIIIGFLLGETTFASDLAVLDSDSICVILILQLPYAMLSVSQLAILSE